MKAKRSDNFDKFSNKKKGSAVKEEYRQEKKQAKKDARAIGEAARQRKKDIENKTTKDIKIRILLESYGWRNAIKYEISLDTFFQIDYKKIKKYAYEYVEFFKKMHLYPFTAAANANPMPVLPEVHSMIVPPGFNFPSRSATSIIFNAIGPCSPLSTSI